MAYAATSRGKLALLGGELCLDFINTVDWRTGPNPEEYLTSYLDLLQWSESIGAIGKRSARRLARKSGADPAGSAAALARAVRFRESLYAITLAVSSGKPAPNTSLQEFNRIFADLTSCAGIGPVDSALKWVWGGDADDLDIPLWPVAVSAFDLLISGDAQRVRQCGDASCGWLFVDKSKSHRRQWCSMRVCGNRAKARRHYEKTKAGNKASARDPEGAI
ncbi:MAG TPA: ABATE domain-containing protein [Blastocatellia bacterium]|nr:ABATE domain-containing protein [Blastocatellia bacterium]